MANINDSSTGTAAGVDLNGTLQTGLFDTLGAPLVKNKGSVFSNTSFVLPTGGVNDSVCRPFRVDRSGGMGSSSYTPVINFPLYSTNLPPGWVAGGSSNTITVSTGVLLNSGAIGTANHNSWLLSLNTILKTQKAPLHFRARARMIMGSANGQAELGLGPTNNPTAGAAIPNGFVFAYGADGTLKPTVYLNGFVDVQGADIIVSSGISAATLSAKYLVWDIIVDDDNAVFIVQDPTSGTVISEQSLKITANDPRFGLLVTWWAHFRTWVGVSANVGTATQLYVVDCSAGILDANLNRLWSHTQAILGHGGVLGPTGNGQLSNYANSAAPTPATLSNTTAGYITLGGQFSFSAPNGAETDYALFVFSPPPGLKFVCTGIMIDTLNIGAAVATTVTWLQWFLGTDALNVTLGGTTYRASLGSQVFPIGAAIGSQAAVIRENFQTPYVTNSNRYMHVGVKVPLGTATASQLIRGTMRIEGYFE